MNKSFLIIIQFILVAFIISGDPNFHIYLAFGADDMQGIVGIDSKDQADIPERFKMMAAIDMPSKGRVKGEWYRAVPPLCRQSTGLTPCDYFGRELVKNLPENITVGVINVAVSKLGIEIFDEDIVDSYLSESPNWNKYSASFYDNHPYKILVESGKKAQKDGVIKGILLHQGIYNTGDKNWPNKLKKIYDRLLKDLGLNGSDVPLLVGELVGGESGGLCHTHNSLIAQVPSIIPNSHVVKSSLLPQCGDGFHFSAEGIRLLGRRYATIMLNLLK